MQIPIVTVSLLVCAGSAILTGSVRRFALASGLVDVPNARSSHTRTTPRGGGLAVVLSTTAGVFALWVCGAVSARMLIAVSVGGGAVALVGFIDDRRPVRPGVRFIVHAGAALWALGWLGGLPPLRFGAHLIQPGFGGYVFGGLGIVWVLNIFNFMDGIDGIAATEAICIASAGALLGLVGSSVGEVSAASWVVALASVGFLFWNWPPARIFLGDVGSGYLGYVVAILALAAARDNPVALWVWLILGGVFFVDATVTLVRRVLRGERAHVAHRSHAYQWLARRWGSHGKVTVALVAVNLVWLLPCAMLAAAFPAHAAMLVLVALAPLAVLAVAIGAGRREAPPSG